MRVPSSREKARRSAADLLGFDPCEDQHEGSIGEDQVETEQDIVARLNQTHAFIAGKGVIRENANSGFAIEPVRDFHHWYSNDGVWSKSRTGTDIFTSASKIWMASPERRQHVGIVLDPRAEIEAHDKSRRAYYNLWRGFSYRASESGSCALFLEHLERNVCRGDGRLYEWLVAWMAHLVQRPWEKPGTAIVLKGEKGVGKSVVGEVLGALVERHFVTVSQPRHLVGNFNAHLSTAVLVLVEEAFWAGDKVGEGALKERITGPRLLLEKKGVDPVEIDSFHRFIITGNAYWIVPATHDERRYAVFNVGTDHRQDAPYFAAIKAQLSSGGYAALLHHLQHFNISGVNVRSPPHSEGLVEQKLAGLRSVEAWWHELLAHGERLNSCVEFDDDAKTTDVWREHWIEAQTLRSSFHEWLRPRRTHGDVLTESEFGTRLRRMCPSLTHKRRRVGQRNKRYFYNVPSLCKCRADFESWFRSPIEWPDNESL